MHIFILKFDSPYVGNPYYVTGNAIYHSVIGRLSDIQRQEISISHGMFFNVAQSVPGSKYAYPRDFRGSGLGLKEPGHSFLRRVKSYEDFYFVRLPIMATLSLPRPYGDMFYEAQLPIRPIVVSNEAGKGHGFNVTAYKWQYLTFYVYGFEGDSEIFDDISVGGRRNVGFGTTSLLDSVELEPNELDYSYLYEDGEYYAELIAPICTVSEFKNTKPFTFPSFLVPNSYRERMEEVKHGPDRYKLSLIDHGQRFKIKTAIKPGDAMKELALTGMRRIGNHTKYGYGEFVVKRLDPAPEVARSPATNINSSPQSSSIIEIEQVPKPKKRRKTG